MHVDELREQPRRVTAPRSRSSVLERATGILEIFLDGPETCLLDDVVGRTGLPRSTAFRLMSQLVDLGWLVHDPRGGYRLGERLRSPGERESAAPRELPFPGLRGAAQEVLGELHRRTRAAVYLGVLDGGRVRYLYDVGGTSFDQLSCPVGRGFLAYHTALGRAMLAGLPPEEVDRLYADDPPTGPVGDLVRLHRELATIRRRNGVVIVQSEGSPLGVATVAAPIPGLQRVRAAIGLVAPEPFQPERCAELLLAASRRIAERTVSNSRC
ncbi:IclR family transcriptional regulator [Nocardioides sp. YIM 152315]|uniref:IclR family transcriptional regulator n=1 Tax=Nocardioides sp. YIM 152315 TaxID=3031760 RepID=UPI0023DAA98A|nr:IclR family transcriptional regulator [Nocardioides sp. YIM 152315]MDF1604681.1 IclR family transcriptional regulator [Nocardioides sp. YIM 152315]